MGATTSTSAKTTTPAPHGAPQRIPALDGLRGVAVVAVVLYHAGRLQGGFLGVDLFFVLSGFLITSILLRGWGGTGGSGSAGLAPFWARRARRLLPALLLMLIVVVPVYALWFATPSELTVLRRDALSTLAYVANWQQIITGQTYWEATLGASPLRHTWSLAVEEQFYLVWPLAVVALLRATGVRAVRAVAVGGALGAAGLTVVFAVAGTFSLNSLYLSTITRSSGLLAGAALATWMHLAPSPRRAKPQPNLPLELAAVAAAAVLGWMIFTMDVSGASLYEWGLAVSMVCGTVLVAAAASPSPGPIVRTLHAAPLRYLGTISYGVYLWSWPVMVMVSERHTSLEGLPLLGVQLALTMAAAQASWMLVERPILDGAIAPPRALPAVLGATVLVAIVTIVVTLGARPTAPIAVGTGGYEAASDPAAPKLLVVGDSVPGVLSAEGIVPLRDELGISVASRAAPGCILLRAQGEVRGTEGNIRTDVGPCNQGWAAQVAELRPDVVWLMFGQFANDEVRLEGEFRRPCDPVYQDALRGQLQGDLDELTSTGARVVIATAPWSSVSWVTASGPVLAERMTCLNDLYRAIADERDDVSIVDLASYICPAPDRCIDKIDGIDLREDTVHFRTEAAQLVARWLIPQVLRGEEPAAAPSDSPLRPGAHPYCLKVVSLIQQEMGPAAPSSTAVVESLRSLDPQELLEGVPPEIEAPVRQLVENWDAYLDLLAQLPPDPAIDELPALLGEFAPVVAQIGTWAGERC